MKAEKELISKLVKQESVYVDEEDRDSYDKQAILDALAELMPEEWLSLCDYLVEYETDGIWFDVPGCEGFPLYEIQRRDENYSLNKFLEDVLEEHPEEKEKSSEDLQCKYNSKYEKKYLVEERKDIERRLAGILTDTYWDNM